MPPGPMSFPSHKTEDTHGHNVTCPTRSASGHPPGNNSEVCFSWAFSSVSRGSVAGNVLEPKLMSLVVCVLPLCNVISFLGSFEAS